MFSTNFLWFLLSFGILAAVAAVVAFIVIMLLITKKAKIPDKFVSAEKLAEFKLEGTTAMRKMLLRAKYIREMTFRFMWIQYGKMLLASAILFAPMLLGNHIAALVFLLGTIISIFLGMSGMYIGTELNWRAAYATIMSRDKAFKVNYIGGAIGGFFAIGITYITFLLVVQFVGVDEVVLSSLLLGASLNAIFARGAGGVYTKSADIGADDAGKSDLMIPEDDENNSAVIADNSGDLINELGASFADIHDTDWQGLGAIVILMTILLLKDQIAMPFLIIGIGMISAMIGVSLIFAIKMRDPKNTKKTGILSGPSGLLSLGNYITYICFIALSPVLFLFGFHWRYWLATILCMIASALVGCAVDYYTNDKYQPTKEIAEHHKGSVGRGIMAGLFNGFNATAISGVVLGIAIYFAAQISAPLGPHAANLGICYGAVGMIAMLPLIATNDGSGPISDNAKSLAECAGLKEEYVAIADENDSAGNTVKAIAKGYILGITAAASAAMLIMFNEVTIKMCAAANIEYSSSISPSLLSGMLIGVAGPLVFCAVATKAVINGAKQMFDYVKKNYEAIKASPEKEKVIYYRECVDMAVNASHKALLTPTMFLILLMLAVIIFLDVSALMGFVIITIFFCIPMGLLFSVSGGAWDNAKKIVESLGLKNTTQHVNAIAADMVGDLLKDVLGPFHNGIIAVTVLLATTFVNLGVEAIYNHLFLTRIIFALILVIIGFSYLLRVKKQQKLNVA